MLRKTKTWKEIGIRHLRVPFQYHTGTLFNRIILKIRNFQRTVLLFDPVINYEIKISESLKLHAKLLTFVGKDIFPGKYHPKGYGLLALQNFNYLIKLISVCTI